jgi:hypothetical protein
MSYITTDRGWPASRKQENFARGSWQAADVKEKRRDFYEPVAAAQRVLRDPSSGDLVTDANGVVQVWSADAAQNLTKIAIFRTNQVANPTPPNNEVAAGVGSQAAQGAASLDTTQSTEPVPLPAEGCEPASATYYAPPEGVQA